MPKPRGQIVNMDATPYYHCVSRCVRRAWLCGEDSISGKNFDHRKTWLRDRIRHLSEIFAIDVCAYALMSNHYHLVVHLDAKRSASWNDAEVLRRYRRLHPFAAKQYETAVGAARAALLKKFRERLASLSWMMSALNEWIAKKANAEEERGGRFWEGRFYSQPLLGLAGLLAGMAYVDLNPMRAGMAKSLEQSDFTSIQDRLVAAALRSQRGTQRHRNRRTRFGAGVVPFQKSGAKQHRKRHRKVLPLSLAEYVAFLSWVMARRESESPQQANLPSILGRIKLNSERWRESIATPDLERRGVLGTVVDIRTYAKRTQRKWVHGIGAASRLEL